MEMHLKLKVIFPKGYKDPNYTNSAQKKEWINLAI